ncbi:diaminopimelate epimerase [Legionella oakridgensis]|nr:diaminopimelate epimerase [Legionella oakridgensis]ETO94241.1 diaminopimelate epimerase [Legionella oakridgensis RV-2-2007]KTD43581.1 diaminopimelate epimerase [Legionella oakridgensis]STY15935.1 diaminopimelate epimerase [Legionella longbeachae]
MTIRFTKMHGLGNDFMVIDAIRQNVLLSPQQIATLSQRDTGIGFDQCLMVEASQETGIDFFYRIFNANGKEVGQCGNGARCLARFLKYYQLTDKTLITVATSTTRMQLQLNDDETVTVNMGMPKFNPASIPLLIDLQKPLYSLPLENQTPCYFHAVNVGNPHAVVLVDRIESAPVHAWGKWISEHPLFPEQTNVGFMHVVTHDHIQLRVYERGCGETKACGSGAVAAAAIGRLYHQLTEQIRVSLPGGELLVQWPQTTGDIFLTGPAVFIYEGTLLS